MAIPLPAIRPAVRLISTSARCPRMMAAIEAGAHMNNTPQTRLAIALLLFCGTGQPLCGIPACGTGCVTPQYGHVSTKSARLPRQLVHAFRAFLQSQVIRQEPRFSCRDSNGILPFRPWFDCQSGKGGRE